MRKAGTDEAGLDQAVDTLGNGGTLVYPTDTLYGLGASIFHMDAVLKTFTLKNMEPTTQSLVMANLGMAEEWVELSDLARKFFTAFPIGPYTFLLPLKDHISLAPSHGSLNSFTPPQESSNPSIPDFLVRDRKIGIRLPLHYFPRKIAERVGPITSTSANVHGGVPPKDFKEVHLPGADMYIDDGQCLYGENSTIITEEGRRLVIVREGALDRRVMKRFLGGNFG